MVLQCREMIQRFLLLSEKSCLKNETDISEEKIITAHFTLKIW